jgi:hypothetical protein
MFREPLSVVTVSQGYGDFLRVTAPLNRGLFDRWVVVTSPADELTQEVCRKFNLRCVVTADGTRDGEFGKGRLIERGLQHLPAEGWVMHLDADIVLPRSFRHDLERAHLDQSCIHGFDRVMVKGWDQWERLKVSGWLDNPSPWHPHGVEWPKGFEVGARWAGGDGWVPIGFAQLWHRNGGGEEWRGARVKSYPSGHGNACREDVQHGLQFDRRKRVLIPEVICVHLESEPCKTGTNWRGRKTKPFEPPSGRPGGGGDGGVGY